MRDETAAPDLNDWVLSTIPELFPQFPKSVVDYLLRDRENNGLEGAVRVIGRSRYVSLSRFAEWVENGSRRMRSGGSQGSGSDLQSESQASHSKNLRRAEHTKMPERQLYRGELGHSSECSLLRRPENCHGAPGRYD